MALRAAEHCRGGGAAAQFDWRSRAAISGGGVSDDLVTDLLRHGRGLALARIADERRPPDHAGAARRCGNRVRRYRQRPTQRPGDLAGQHADHQGGDRRNIAGPDRYEFDPDDLVPIQTEITRQISRELHLLVLQRASRRAATTSGDEFGVNECLARATSALKGRITPGTHRRGAELAAQRARQRSAQCRSADRSRLHLPASRQPTLVGQSAGRGDGLRSRARSRRRWRWPWRRAMPSPIASKGCCARRPDSWRRRPTHSSARSRPTDGWASPTRFAGYNAVFLGHAEETMPAVERAMRLDQTDRRHSIWFFFGGFAELLLGRTEASIALLQKSLERNPSYGGAQLFLMAALSLIGRRGEAARTAASFREHYPGLPRERFRAAMAVALGLARLSRADRPGVREDPRPRRRRLSSGRPSAAIAESCRPANAARIGRACVSWRRAATRVRARAARDRSRHRPPPARRRRAPRPAPARSRPAARPGCRARQSSARPR